MPQLIILGTSNAIPDKNHENTHMVYVGKSRVVLVDCAGNPIVRLAEAGVGLESITDIILTHFHPDHVSGVPLLLMNMWLTGRRDPLNIYGLHHTLDRMESLMSLYSWEEWPGFFPVAFFRLPLQEMSQVLDCDDVRIVASPVHHMIPAIGIRFENKLTKRILAYSCDTEPCREVVRLAEGANILIHEAAGAILGHSSAEQAAEIAAEAGVEELFLVHYPTGKYYQSDLALKASKHFKGMVYLAEDYLKLKM